MDRDKALRDHAAFKDNTELMKQVEKVTADLTALIETGTHHDPALLLSNRDRLEKRFDKFFTARIETLRQLDNVHQLLEDAKV